MRLLAIFLIGRHAHYILSSAIHNSLSVGSHFKYANSAFLGLRQCGPQSSAFSLFDNDVNPVINFLLSFWYDNPFLPIDKFGPPSSMFVDVKAGRILLPSISKV